MANQESESHSAALVTPGELITEDSSWMRGHGTYAHDGLTYSAVAGTVERVNKLLSVKTLKGRYIPVIGDHVIGRVTQVGNKRWRVDIGATQDAVLQLSSINLPGGVLRRKSDQDELQMREFLKEGDLLNAEIQSLYEGGAAALHTRSLRYGKLRNGMLVMVQSALVTRVQTQYSKLNAGVDAILGVNGWIWLQKATAPTQKVAITRLEQESRALEIYRDDNDSMQHGLRQTITRFANCLQALAFTDTPISGPRLEQIYEASLEYGDAGELLNPAVMRSLASSIS